MPPPELASHPDAVAGWRRRERRAHQAAFPPQPHLTPSEWGDLNRIISQGPRRGERMLSSDAPYLVEILDFVANPWARKGVVRKSARVGYTEYVVGNGVAWTIAMDPAPIAVIQPSDGSAQDYSKEQFAPMVAANPALSEILGPTGVRRSDSTLTYKEFPGGYLAILGSASDTNMRRRSLRRAYVDEVDAMVLESDEGDPILRIQKRTDDYEDGVVIVGSTPTLKLISRIDRQFAETDQRYWHVPCPHCADEIVLEWGEPDTPYGIKWDKELFCRACGAPAEYGAESCEACGAQPPEDSERIPLRVRHLPETAYYLCPSCGAEIDEAEKPAMVRAGRWVATEPEKATPGWHIDALVSLFPGARWGKITQEFLDAGRDAEKLQVFWNTVLGRAFEERGEVAKVETLEGRAEDYGALPDGSVAEVPDGVGVLTAMTDVQGDRLELLVRGWGLGEESWDILHERIPGDPEAESTWARLEALLTKAYRHVNGGTLRIRCAMIDAGYLTHTVYGFVKPREPRQVYASMGDKRGDPTTVPLSRPVKANAEGVKVYTIGTYKMKKRLLRRLAINEPGPRYMHLRSHNPKLCNGFDAEYYKQFGGQKHIIRRGKPMYVKSGRDETIDLHVGNLAAFDALGAPLRAMMPELVAAARQPPEPEEPAGQQRGRSEGEESSWAYGWKR